MVATLVTRSRRRIALALALAALAAATFVSGALPVAAQQGEQKTLVSGWYDGREVRYYDFGANTPLVGEAGVPTAPIYVFIHGMNADGTPQIVEGQHNIVDVVPGDQGYSDLWQVNFVLVPADYQADSIRSKAEIDAGGFEVTQTDMLVNCPIVPQGTTLEGGEPLVQGWAKGEAVFYPDFGANPATAEPIYVLVHGMNPDGTPRVVEGQRNIIDTVPGDPNYTAFWRVTFVVVGDDYEANTIRSADDVVAGGFEMTPTDMVVNCPVTEVASAAAGVGALPATGDGSSVDDSGATWMIASILGAAGLLVASGGALFLRGRARRSQ